MTGSLLDRRVLGGSLLFIAMVCYALYIEQWIALALPLIPAIIIFAFFRPKALLLGIVFMTPLSLNLEELDMSGVAFYLPTEPLLFGMTILLILAQLHRQVIPREILYHPISLAIYAYLGWMLVTAFTSVDPLVSFKFILSKVWFIVPVYFAGATLFLQERNIRLFLLAYLIPLVAVVIYILFRHNSFGWDEEAAQWVMEPFYRDHTQLGAVLAFFIPVVFGFLIERSRTMTSRAIFFVMLVLLSVSLIYGYSRAAWLSVFLALGIWLLTILRIRVWLVMTGGLLVAFLLFISFDDLKMRLQGNRTDSSENLVENVESITNITTDASNLERINRWNSVFAMAKERPIFGFGPGTYMFEYAPYQQSRDLTIISTNFGDVGNAHSEYLGPLAESGVLGMLTVVILVVIVFWSAFVAYHRLEPGGYRHLLVIAYLSLITYFSHGFLNNFLDSDKASVPVFGAMAIVAAIDVVSRKQAKNR